MKLAIAQTAIVWEDKEKNLEKAKKFIREAADRRADLILFPEMSFTGFSMNTSLTAEYHGETAEAVRRMARTYHLAIGFGWVKAGVNKAQNHYTVIDREGELLSDYAKIHPFSYSDEDCYFEGGERLSSFVLGDVNVGTLICYDLRFPEPFQILAEQCSIIVVPANWPARRREHWKTLLKARAIETQCCLIGINCCGEQEGLDYSGDSAVFAPDGTAILDYQEEEGIYFVNIPDNVKSYREEFPTRKDRKWELYQEWYRSR